MEQKRNLNFNKMDQDKKFLWTKSFKKFIIKNFKLLKKKIKKIPKRSKRAEIYQNKLEKVLRKVFKDHEIKSGEPLEMPNGSYSPEIDITIGPFAIQKKSKINCNNLLKNYKRLLNKIKTKAINSRNLDFYRNPNPRCFIAIEVEDKTQQDKKHVIGSICNTYLLAKVGIVITFDNRDTLRSIYEYLKFSKRVGKTKEYLFKNVALITKDDFDEAVKEHIAISCANDLIQNVRYGKKGKRK